MKKYKQNEEGKKELEESSIILKVLKNHTNNVFDKEGLIAFTGKSERQVRAELEHIANFYPIRATAGRKGYKLLTFEEDASVETLKEVNMEAFLQICELQNRINSLKARMKPLIAIQRATALKLQEKGVDLDNE